MIGHGDMVWIYPVFYGTTGLTQADRAIQEHPFNCRPCIWITTFIEWGTSFSKTDKVVRNLPHFITVFTCLWHTYEWSPWKFWIRTYTHKFSLISTRGKYNNDAERRKTYPTSIGPRTHINDGSCWCFKTPADSTAAISSSLLISWQRHNIFWTSCQINRFKGLGQK